MKHIFLAAVLFTSNIALATVPETGAWDVNCLVFTTGPSGADVNILASGDHHLVLDNTNPKTVLYTEGRYEYRTWLNHFQAKDRPELVANQWELGIFKDGKYISGSTAEFSDELPAALQVVVKNYTKIKGPPKVSISCRRN